MSGGGFGLVGNIVVGIVGAVVAGWLISVGAMAIRQYQSEAARWSLLDREAKVATAENRVAAYRDDLGEVTESLERRQKFLEEMTEMLPADAVDGNTVSDSSEEAARTVEKVSASIPEAAALARIEARQLALGLVALMYGGLTLSRALKGTPLSDEVLRGSRELGKAALAASRSSDPTDA